MDEMQYFMEKKAKKSTTAKSPCDYSCKIGTKK